MNLKRNLIASLPMYDRLELTEAHNRYWALIRDGLRAVGLDAPEHLVRGNDEAVIWTDSGLVLSQTCGMPYRSSLHGKVALVGTPDFGVNGCPPGYYRSAFVVRGSDPRSRLEEYRHAIFAYNQTMSQSGYAAPYWHVAPLGFWFEHRLQCNHHRNSARAVADGAADIAALDAVSWRLMERYDGFAGALRVLAWTEPTPGLPYITAKDHDADAVGQAVREALGRLSDKDRAALGIKNLVAISPEDYLAIPNPPTHGS